MQIGGPQSSPVGASPRLSESWSKTENIEWLAEIPGRGWSSPIVTGGKVFLTTVTTDGKSKPPRMGTDYSNEYMAELQKQGLSEKQIVEKVTERDIELPAEVTVHYFLYCLNLKTGKPMWKREFYTGRPPGGRHRKNSFCLRDAGDRRETDLRLRGQSRSVCLRAQGRKGLGDAARGDAGISRLSLAKLV